MLDQDSAPIERLLAAVMATHEAFTVAAQSAGATGFASEFARRAEYQARIASHMRGMRAPVGLASDALWRVPVVAVAATAADHPRILFDRCLRVQDAATLEFCRGYSPTVALVLTDAIQAAQAIETTQHRTDYSGPSEDGLEWASGDLSQTN